MAIFDVSAVKDLAEAWNVPIFPHEREFPFQTGSESTVPYLAAR